MNPAILLERMREQHIPAAARIEYAHFGPEAWTEEMFRSELIETTTRYWRVALREIPSSPGPVGSEATSGSNSSRVELLGYAGLCVYGDIAPDDREVATAWIQNIGVAPEHQGEGIGSRLLADLLGEARRRAATVSLEVRADDERAQRFYARHGFEAIAMRKMYYQPSGADAIVMQAQLNYAAQ